MNSKLRIFGAFCVGISLVAGAFFVADQRAAPSPDPRVEAIVATAPERTFIAIDDTDGDGHADWKKTLSPGSLQLGSSTSKTSSTTRGHTATLAINTLERLMLSNMGVGPSANTEDILISTNTYLNTLATVERYDTDDILTSTNSSVEALRAYGNRVAEIAFTHDTTDAADEMTLLNRALETRDASTLEQLTPIAESYRNMTADMLQTPVPEILRDEHLSLLNAYHILAADITAIQQTLDDAVYALAYFERYWSDGNALYRAIADVYTTLHEEGVRWEATDRASAFIRIRSES